MANSNQNNRYGELNILKKLHSNINGSKDKFKKGFISKFYSSDNNKKFSNNVLIFFSRMFNMLRSQEFFNYIIFNNSTKKNIRLFNTRSQKFMELLSNFENIHRIYIDKYSNFSDVSKENINSLIKDIFLKMKEPRGVIFYIFKSLLANYVDFFLNLPKNADQNIIFDYLTEYKKLYNLFKKYCRVPDTYSSQTLNNKGNMQYVVKNSNHFESYKKIMNLLKNNNREE
jgi:hypothetical protein